MLGRDGGEAGVFILIGMCVFLAFDGGYGWWVKGRHTCREMGLGGLDART